MLVGTGTTTLLTTLVHALSTQMELLDMLPNGTTQIRIQNEFMRISDADSRILRIQVRGEHGTPILNHTRDMVVNAYTEVTTYDTWKNANTTYNFVYQKWDYYSVNNIITSEGPSTGEYDIVIHGYGFDPLASPAYSCKFYRGNEIMYSNQVYVASVDRLVCRAPRWGTTYVGGVVEVEITGQGQLVIFTGNEGTKYAPASCYGTTNSETLSPVSRCSFSLYTVATGVVPNQAGSSGGMEVQVMGFGLNITLAYRCLFYNGSNLVMSDVATNVSLIKVTCIVPIWLYGSGSVWLRVYDDNLKENRGELQFTFFASWSHKNVSSAPSLGGPEIYLKIVGIRQDPGAYVCSFSRKSLQNPAELQSVNSVLKYLTNTTGSCTVPPWSYEGSEYVDFSIRNTDTGSTEVPFGGKTSAKADALKFVYSTSWQSFGSSGDTSVAIPASGNTELLISAYALDSRVRYVCRFNRTSDNGGVEVMTSKAIFVSPTVLKCITPEWGKQYIGGRWLDPPNSQKSDFQMLQSLPNGVNSDLVLPYDSFLGGRLSICSKCVHI
jgi:hypothetical protein